MWFFIRKTSPRRTRLRKSISARKPSIWSHLADPDLIISVLLGLGFAAACLVILSFEVLWGGGYMRVVPLAGMVVLLTAAGCLYIHRYQKRITRNHARALALLGLFIVLLAVTRFGTMATGHSSWATGAAVTAAICLTIAYDQRFALGMSVFYVVFASFAAGGASDNGLLLTMAAAVFTCCFSLGEIRTRMKLLEVSTLTAVVVFTASLAMDSFSQHPVRAALADSGYHAIAALAAGLFIQSLLPVIEKTFRIATSMTLLDYSDANQPLLRRLAMEAPGTFSHSLLIGSIAEAAAEAIGRNGLLCRVGAYYHDIGKINNPSYFVENELGSTSRHKDLSPAMSQLVIVGHVKDGVEMAREYGLPAVLRQFIESHHGTTLVEYFYDKAKKQRASAAGGKSNAEQQEKSQPEPSESEFRYVGPRPQTKEAAIVMLADSVEGLVRAMPEVTPAKIETAVHNMAMKRLQDGQFDECDLSLKELSQIEASISKTLTAHYHARIPYPAQQ